MNHALRIALVAAVLAFSPLAPGAELKVAASDSVESVLAAQKGKRVTLRLRSGQEATGTVATVNAKVVQLAGVAGKEFFDAVVPLDAIEAVYIRTKD